MGSLLPIRAALVWNNGRDVDPAEVRRWGKAVEGIVDGWAWTFLQKQNDQSVTSTTLTAATTIVVPLLANTNYLIKAAIFCALSPTPDMKWRTVGPASPTRVRIAKRTIRSGASAYENIGADVAYSAADNVIDASGGTENAVITLDGLIENGANAGNFEFHFAQNNVDATGAAVWRGSWMAYRKLTV